MLHVSVQAVGKDSEYGEKSGDTRDENQVTHVTKISSIFDRMFQMVGTRFFSRVFGILLEISSSNTSRIRTFARCLFKSIWSRVKGCVVWGNYW